MALLATLVVVSNVLRRNAVVHDLKVQITYGAYTDVPRTQAADTMGADLSRTVDTLITASTLRGQILSSEPTLLNRKVKEVDCRAVARLAQKSRYIESARASVSIRGDIVVKAVQRTPVVRVFMGQKEFYLDHCGQRMPLSREGEADVLVGSGRWPKESKQALHEMWTLVLWLYDNPLYGSLFDQVSYEEGDLVLVPKVGNHTVVIGTPDKLEKKMSDLLAFYRKGMPQVGWNTYRQISLKYDNQVICKKR